MYVSTTNLFLIVVGVDGALVKQLVTHSQHVAQRLQLPVNDGQV